MNRSDPCLRAACVAIVAGSMAFAHAATVTLIPSADTTLIEGAPDNSMGAAEYVLSGTTQNGPRNHALLKFDVASELPAGAKITGASLTITAVRQSREAPAGVSFGVHRVLVAWSEGVNISGPQPGLGSPANQGDSTWNNRFFPGANWGAPGGLEGIDFVGQASSSVIVDTLGSFPLDDTFELIADVQSWLDNPSANFGWLLKSESEEVRFSARQFASREYSNPNVSPQLVIDYTPPPHFTIERISGPKVRISIGVEMTGSYALEARQSLSVSNSWQTLTNFGIVAAGATLVATDSAAAGQSFYRIRMQ